jgi:hypothetical protein
MGDPGILVQFSVGERDLRIMQNGHKGPDMHPGSCLMGTGDSFPGGKRKVVRYSPLTWFSAEVRNKWSCVSIQCFYGAHKNSVVSAIPSLGSCKTVPKSERFNVAPGNPVGISVCATSAKFYILSFEINCSHMSSVWLLPFTCENFLFYWCKPKIISRYLRPYVFIMCVSLNVNSVDRKNKFCCRDILKLIILVFKQKLLKFPFFYINVYSRA